MEKGYFLALSCVGGWKMQCVFYLCLFAQHKKNEHSVEQEGRWQFIGRVESVENKNKKKT